MHVFELLMWSNGLQSIGHLMVTDLIFLQFMFSYNNHIPSSLFCLYHLEGFNSQILGSVQEVEAGPMRFQFHVTKVVVSGSGCVYHSSWESTESDVPREKRKRRYRTAELKRYKWCGATLNLRSNYCETTSLHKSSSLHCRVYIQLASSNCAQFCSEEREQVTEKIAGRKLHYLRYQRLIDSQ